MSSQFVIDVTEASFQKEVMEFSMNTPVLLDFWAEWCGPCKTLSPLLDEIANEYKGAIRIAKVNTETEQRLAGAFQIQSIPTVMAVYGGQMLEQFQGSLPKEQIRQFVDAVLAVGGADPEQELEATDDPVAATAHWQQKLAQTPNDPEALLELSRLILGAGQPNEAKPLLQKIEVDARQFSEAQATIATIDLLDQVSDAGGPDAVSTRFLEDSDEPQNRYLMACLHAGCGRLIESLSLLVELIAGAPQDTKEKARSAASTVFEAAGRNNDEIEKLRRRLTALLF
ncbi:MAG TPA: thioredoxin [Myxococcales bacterium]|nr:thioredoxin [Myxococcales bacterium]HIN85817.1 thioredoxin [Myxococcales bacterium]